MKVKYSVVVPVFNEEEAIPLFYKAIIPVMDKTAESYEIIFVNDGSRDNTAKILKDIAEKDERIRVINFSRNFGQQAALLCGFEHSSGDAVIDIDVDLQDPAEVILQMIDKWKQGYDVVHGKRAKRKGETVFKKFTAFLYARFLRKITSMDIPKDTGDFKLFDRKVIDVITSMKEKNRFLRGLTTWVGFKQTSVEFERQERSAGETKYTLKKLIKTASNGIVAYSKYPLFMSLKTGIGLGLLSILCFVVFIVLAICGITFSVAVWLIPTITTLFSISFVFNGMTNIYLSRVYDEVLERPNYIIEDKYNF